MTKKEEELKFSKFFIERFNKHHSFNYQAVPNDRESAQDSDVDVYGIEAGRDRLNLQVTTGEGELKGMWAGLRKEAKKTGISIGSTMILSIPGKVGQAIKLKSKYSPEAKKSLIMLITEESGPTFDENYTRIVFNDFRNSDFKGVYLVKFPIDSNVSSRPHSGQIVAVKDIFGSHGETF